jgi:hypothetical protein
MQNQTRAILKTGFSNAKEVLLEIDRLTVEFKNLYKRNSDVELFLSEYGSIKESKFDLVAYYDGKDKVSIEDVDNFRESLASQYNN